MPARVGPGGRASGLSVAGAGDVNGDGYADVIVGAHYDAGERDEGAAFVFLGSASGIAAGTRHRGCPARVGPAARLGRSVAGAGDVNGDGYADVIVGALYDAGETNEGAAFVFHGSASGIADGDPVRRRRPARVGPGTRLGASVAGAGDVNGDGYADVIVGALLRRGPDRRGRGLRVPGQRLGDRDGNPAPPPHSSSRTRRARTGRERRGRRGRQWRRLRRRDRGSRRLRRGRGTRAPPSSSWATAMATAAPCSRGSTAAGAAPAGSGLGARRGRDAFQVRLTPPTPRGGAG